MKRLFTIGAALFLLAGGWALPALAQNVICVPDTTLLNVAGPTGTIDVDYLGGGSGLLYGFSITFAWDGSVAATTPAQVNEGNLLSDQGATWFEVHSSGADSIIVDCVLLGGQPGVSGPGTLFSIEFDGVAYGESPVLLTIESVRDSANNDLTGFLTDDGLIMANLNGPTVTVVEITDATIASTVWVKDGDAVVITATVNDTDHGSGDVLAVTANLNGLYGGAGHGADPPTSGTYPAYTWLIPAAIVVCSPANGTVQVDIDVVDAGGNTGSGFDTITSDNTPPDAVADMDVTPHFHRTNLVWTVPLDSWGVLEGIEIHRARWNDYPEYAPPPPAYPATPGVGEPDFVASLPAPGAVFDDIFPNDFANRDIYYYTAWAKDEAGNYSVPDSGSRDRSTDYWLGDVTSSGGGYDGYIDFFDINILSAAYRLYTPSNPPPPPFNELDVGFTLDGTPYSPPVPDDHINFEELMIFALGFNVVSPTAKREVQTVAGKSGALSPPVRLEVRGGEAEGSRERVVLVYLDDGGASVQGASILIEFDPSILGWIETVAGNTNSLQGGPLFFRSGLDERGLLWIDAAALGDGGTIDDSRELALVRFRSIAAGDPGVRLVEADLRSTANEPLHTVMEEIEESRPLSADSPTRFAGAWPNPFNPVTTIHYELAVPEHVRLRVFDSRGRLVRDLVNEVRESGAHQVVWDGRDSSGRNAGSGVYFVQMSAGDYRNSSRLVILK